MAYECCANILAAVTQHLQLAMVKVFAGMCVQSCVIWCKLYGRKMQN